MTMDSSVRVILTDPGPDIREAWTETFEDRPEVAIGDRAVFQTVAAAWVVQTKRGDLAPDARKALGIGVEKRLREIIRVQYGGSLPADFAVCVATSVGPPKFAIAVSNGARNPHGVDDRLRVAIAAGAALQAVHMQNAKARRSIDSIVLPPLGPESVPPRERAELMWTAYALFREAEMPDFPTMRRALSGLLVGADPDGGPGAFKRSFGTSRPGDPKTTVPERAAATVRLRRQDIDPDD
ncbi:MAG: hypothetical protein KC619_29685 [Myxococcales bacterium]|nr:hypothetical protein [Myxococcales bacterium]